MERKQQIEVELQGVCELLLKLRPFLDNIERDRSKLYKLLIDARAEDVPEIQRFINEAGISSQLYAVIGAAVFESMRQQKCEHTLALLRELIPVPQPDSLQLMGLGAKARRS